jgi:hypothetical protein
MKRLIIIAFCVFATVCAFAQHPIFLKPHGETRATEKEKWHRWYLEAGLGLAIATPASLPETSTEYPVRTKAALIAPVGVGFHIHPKHRITLGGTIGGSYKRKIGDITHTYYHLDGTPTGEKKVFTIYRVYSPGIGYISYQYVFPVSDYGFMRLGPSFGSFSVDAETFCNLKDNDIPKDKVGPKETSYFGFSLGYSLPVFNRWTLDGGYRISFLGKAVEIDDFKYKAPMHQLSLTVNWWFW